MYKYRNFVLVIIFLLTFPSCCFTTTRTVESESSSAYLRFTPEVEGAKIYLDGEYQDFTLKYTDDRSTSLQPQKKVSRRKTPSKPRRAISSKQFVLEVPPGRHSVKVTDEKDKVIFYQDIYIDRGQTRTIHLPVGN
jgi:hypothetical protein